MIDLIKTGRSNEEHPVKKQYKGDGLFYKAVYQQKYFFNVVLLIIEL